MAEVATAREELAREWPVLLVATLGCSVGVASLFFYSVGLFIAPLEASFGWSRTALSSGSVAASLSLAAFSPLAGSLIDRWGVRLISSLSLAALAAGFLALSAVPNSLAIYLAIVILTAILASGCSPLVFTRALVNRFDKARGTALGVAISGTGLGGLLAPQFLMPYIEQHGWRAGYVALSITVLLVLPIIAMFLSERSPKLVYRAATPLSGLTFGEARRTPAFLIIGCLLAAGALGITGVTVHLMPMLLDRGLSTSEAARIVSLIGIAIIAGRLCSGFLVDRFHARFVGASLLISGAIGAVLLSISNQFASISAILVGLAMGAEGDLMGYLVSRYFGMRSYGTIFGWLYAAFLIGAAGGPLLAGYLFDSTGNYIVALLISAGAMASAAVACLFLKRYPTWQ